MLTQSVLKFWFHYDETTGVFTRTKDKGRGKKGQRAGTIHSKGYEVIRIDDKLYKSHRLAWLYVYGKWPDQIDHINGDRKDNRICNLRLTSSAENMQNRHKPNPRNTSGHKGVGWYKPLCKWRVKIMKDYKTIHLGYYKNLDDAIKAYAQGAAKYHTVNPSAEVLP